MIGKIIVFRFPKKTNQKNLNQFCKKFYGQETSSQGRKYHYRRKGLLDDIPHIKLIGGVIIVSNENADRLIRFLNDYGAEFFVRDVILLPEDEDILGKTLSI
ncbi:MAG: hypothetical protein O8C63_04430 [Candidatus Methanoperedens sp.]|nr:hypothetical protein [Candidatus Methanoperedens sp.]